MGELVPLGAEQLPGVFLKDRLLMVRKRLVYLSCGARGGFLAPISTFADCSGYKYV